MRPPDVTSLLYFPLIDDTIAPQRFQSGNLFADLTPKASYAAMKARSRRRRARVRHGGVVGESAVWHHRTDVLGAAVRIFGRLGTRPPRPAGLATAGIAPLETVVTADEDASYTAMLRKVGGGPVGTPLKGVVKAYLKPPIQFQRTAATRPVPTSSRIVLSALTNPGRRTTFTSKPFVVSKPAR